MDLNPCQLDKGGGLMHIPCKYEEIRKLVDEGKITNYKVYEVVERNSSKEFLGYTYIATYEYEGKYCIVMDIFDRIVTFQHGRIKEERRHGLCKAFETKEYANNYFRKVIKGKPYKRT